MACFVKTCKNIKRLLPPNSGITFHRFPVDKVMFSKWLKAIGRDKENKMRTKNMLICSDHFSLDDFVEGHGVRRIKKKAIPLSIIFLEKNILSSPSGRGSNEVSEIYKDYFDLTPKQINMVVCAVVGCGNRSTKKSLEQLDREGSGIRISFHKFPNSAKNKAAWVNAIKRSHWSPGKYSVICSDHFTRDCFDKSPFHTNLLPNSIPTVFPIAHYNQQVSDDIKIIDAEDTEMIDVETVSLPEQLLISEKNILPSTFVSTSTNNLFSSTSVSLDRRKDGPFFSLTKFQELNYRAAMYEKKIEILRRKNKQQQKTIATLRNILSVLEQKK